MGVPTIVDEVAAAALREILADPALPVGTTAAGPDGARVSALREAHDYLGSTRLGAAAARSPEHAAALVAELARVDPVLAATVGAHAGAAALLAGLPPSPARNAVLGDVHRGDLLTWAARVRSWAWHGGAPPDGAAPIGRADAVLEVDHHPGLYSAVLAWEPTAAAVVVVPTHRDRVTWEPLGPPVAGEPPRWTVRLAAVTVHVAELIPIDRRALPAFPPSPGGPTT